MKKQVLGKRAKTHDASKLKMKKLMYPDHIGISSYGESQKKRARIAEMKRRVLGKRARTHDTNKLKMKKKARSSQKKPMGAVEIETTAYGFPLKDEPLIFLTDDDSEEEYLRPVSPEVVDLRDRYPPRRDWGRIITDPPVCSDHKKSEPDSHDSDWVLRVMELNETEHPDMEDDTPLSHAIEGKPEVKLTLEV